MFTFHENKSMTPDLPKVEMTMENQNIPNEKRDEKTGFWI